MEHSHAHSFMYCLLLLLHLTAELGSYYRDPVSGPLQRKFINPCFTEPFDKHFFLGLSDSVQHKQGT